MANVIIRHTSIKRLNKTRRLSLGLHWYKRLKLAFQSLQEIVDIVTLNADTRKFSELMRKRLHKN